MPEGMEMPEIPTNDEMPQPPEGMEMPEGGQMPGGEEGEGAGGGSDSGILKERFFDNEEFYAMHEQAYAELYEQLIASRYAEETLNELTARAEEAATTTEDV